MMKVADERLCSNIFTAGGSPADKKSACRCGLQLESDQRCFVTETVVRPQKSNAIYFVFSPRPPSVDLLNSTFDLNYG